jgi:predicted HicB family RNase H-like nuclease
MAGPTELKQLSFKIDAEVYRRIRVQAAVENTSMRELIENTLDAHLPKEPALTQTFS